MAGYSRMDIMSLSEEEIRRILKEKYDTLPDYTVCLMVEELKKREEYRGASKGEEKISEDTEDFLEQWRTEHPGEEDEPTGEESEDGEKEDFEGGSVTADGFESDQTDTDSLAENKSECLCDETKPVFEELREGEDGEETAEKSRENVSEELRRMKKERRNILIFALTGAGITALAIVCFLLYLHFSGEL